MSNTTTDALTAAADTGADFRQREAAVRADPALTAEARGRELATIEMDRARALLEHKQADRTQLADAHATAWRSIFGPATDLAARATADRRAAELTTPNEALAALDRAELIGDEELARAIASAAYDRVRANPLAGAGNPGPWGSLVLARFVQSRPDAADALAELLPGPKPRTARLGRRIGLEARAGR